MKQQYLKTAILFLSIFCIQTETFAQSARLYDSGSGLPSTQINDLLQDSNGLMWVATNNGLYRFDGINFVEFHHDQDKENSINSDLVASVFEDSKGVIWVGTSAGLQIFDPEYNTFTDFPLSERNISRYVYGIDEATSGQGKSIILVSASQFGIYAIDADSHESDRERRERFSEPEHSSSINALFVDSKSRIWAGSELGGMYVFDPMGKVLLEGMWDGLDPSIPQRIIATSFAEDPASGDIIIGTSNYGILLFKEESGKIVRPSDKEARDCKVMSLLSVKQFSLPGNQSLLVGTENEGFSIYSCEDGTLRPFSFPNVPYNTGGWKVHKLLEDNQGNLWISAYQTGLMIVPQSMFGFRYFNFRRGDHPGDEMYCLTSACRDAESGRTWLGSDGNGIFLLESNGDSINYNSSNSDLPDDSVMGVAFDTHGTLWIGTYLDGIVTYSQREGFKAFQDNDAVGSVKIYCLVYNDVDGLLYAGTHGNGVAVIDPVERKVVKKLSGRMNDWINSLTFDSAGTLWIGTYSGHWCYNPETDQTFRADLKDPELLRARVYSIAEGKNGVIWIGTGEGLIRFDQAKGETKVYTVKDGLTSNLISGVIEGDDGSIWVSTSYGLTRINQQTGKISRYYEYDGLQGNEFRANAFYKSARGQLFFGGTKGLTAFFPQVVSQKLHDIPPLVFTRLTVADKEVEFDPDDEDNILDKHITEATRITLPFRTNSFSLEYAVPEFTNPDRIRYAYKLSRIDNDWKTVSPFSRTATYTNLPQGRYTMSVKAYFDGDEDNFSIREIGVRVLPPWYLSIWAFLMFAILAAGIAALIVSLIQKDRLHKQERRESAMKETKLQMFTDISHEIRTPLNLVMSPLGKLIDKETDPEKKESFEMMYRNSENILRLMNRIEESRRNSSDERESAPERNEGSVRLEEEEVRSLKSKKNLLLVDDNPEMLHYLKMELKDYFNIQTCATAEEAWKKTTGTIPDAVVTDFTTKGEMDGADLCSRIKKNPSTNLVPVLILSSQWDEATLRKCTESGADRYLVKPVPVDLLRTTILKAISTREIIRNKYTSDVNYDYDEITIKSSEKYFLPKVVDTIKVHLSDPDFGVEELSREIGMSRVHMNRKLKEAINISPSSLIKSIKLKQAAYLLVNNKVNISEVAYRVGFSTHSYFSSSFKEYFGMSPKEFIAKYSEPGQEEALNKLLEI